MKSKLFFLLQKLGKKEQKRFFDYVESPFFNKNKKILSLISYYKGFAPSFTASNLTAENAYRIIYGTDKYDELRLNNLNSDILQLLYDFLAFEWYNSKPEQKVYWTGKALLEKDLSSTMKPIFKRLNALRGKRVLKNGTALEMEMQFYELHDEWTISDGKRGYSESLVKRKTSLEEYSFLKKIEIACDMVSRNAAIQANYDTGFIVQLEAQFEQEKSRWEEIPIVLIYYTTLKVLLGKESEENYNYLKKLLADYPSIFPKEELRTLYNFLLNFCVKQINSGYVKYYAEVLAVYKILLNQRIIYKNGFLSQWAFTNICTAGIRLEQYDWTASFINDFQSDLLPAYQLNVVNYNRAALFYAQQNWDAALQLLQTVIFTDAYYQTAAKTIQLKIYYEKNEQEAFRALIEAFGKFISRNKQLSTYQKKSNKQFLSFAFKLFKLRDEVQMRKKKGGVEKLAALLLIVKETHPISNKNWIIKQGEAIC